MSYDSKSNSESIDFAWAFGLRYKLRMGLGIDARYNLGLTNLLKNNNSESSKHSVFQFGAFYLFGGIKS